MGSGADAETSSRGPLLRTLAGVALIGVLLWQVGTGPVLDGLRMIDGPALAAALGIGVLTTVCGAWRWSLVAGGLGVRLPLGTAVVHCYRAIFLNSTLPGGVLGDVHRAVRHGRDVGDVGRGVRSVVWERLAGQVIQVGVALVLLCALPSPVQRYLPFVAAVAVAGGVVVVLSARLLPRSGPSRWARTVRGAAADIRHGLLAGRVWVGVVLATVVAFAGHLATFLLAARVVGADAPLSRLLPLTLLALMAMILPLNVAGFGPREGVAAWAFAAAGLTAAQGVSTAMVYGALVLAASLPGAFVLIIRRIRVPAPGRESVAGG
ncbi:lysylphosphatidylglycerol synthase transmembrane domain-containing protein [Micromonospora sp. SH-82]|uniref:lysylphosphatidylglycerol synthase transmembrane domain-containing protein n=1 Tax=Micromonospora sp. SH-82 TaxID=3132938 RepID=UPI003EBCF9F4